MGDANGGPDVPEPPKLWTVGEADLRLDGLRELLPRLRAWAVRLQAIGEERERLATFWGAELTAPDHPDHGLLDRLDRETETLHAQLDRGVRGLHGEGIEVKDLDAGLVDFYGLVDREVVFLCWRRGEPDVAFYHRLDGGFRTRRPLEAKPGGTVPDLGRRTH
ncbi:MAG: DUF2203 domain-containing protein [Thermoplasmata archaeon]|nr:DUF2203 domain-containing protein [Thermoplasmata archaeon]